MKKTVILASIALVGLLGCNDNRTADKTAPSSPPSAPEKTTQTAPSPTSPTGATAMNETDQALAKRVEDALHQNSAVASAAQNVQVEAKNGEVTLKGSVNNEQEKTNIASTAQKVAGVAKVNNEIEVASASSR